MSTIKWTVTHGKKPLSLFILANAFLLFLDRRISCSEWSRRRAIVSKKDKDRHWTGVGNLLSNITTGSPGSQSALQGRNRLSRVATGPSGSQPKILQLLSYRPNIHIIQNPATVRDSKNISFLMVALEFGTDWPFYTNLKRNFFASCKPG